MGLDLSLNLSSVVSHFVGTLNNFDPKTLREVVVNLNVPTIGHIIDFLRAASKDSSQCPELENELLRFPQPNIWVSLHVPIHTRRYVSWKDRIEGFFPTLAKRRAVTFKSEWCE